MTTPIELKLTIRGATTGELLASLLKAIMEAERNGADTRGGHPGRMSLLEVLTEAIYMFHTDYTTKQGGGEDIPPVGKEIVIN